MRTILLVSLIACASISAAERLLHLKFGSQNILDLPPSVEKLWVSGSPGFGKVMDLKSLGPNRFGLHLFPSAELGHGNQSTIGALRIMDKGMWSSIRPVVLDAMRSYQSSSELVRTNAFVPESGVYSFPFTVTGDWEVAEFEVVANRLGSALDPIVQVKDERGKVLAYFDDDPKAGRDLRIKFDQPFRKTSFKSKWNARYTLEIADVANKGGDDYFFVLRGRFESQAGCLKFPNIWVEDNTLSSIECDDEPNGRPVSAAPLKIPSFGSGTFNHKNGDDNDWYELRVAADQRLIISSETRRYGSGCDAGLAIYDSDGKLISESVGAGENGPSLTNRFSKEGVYRIELRELSKRSGPNCKYWLNVAESSPGVFLTADTDRVEMKSETEATIKVAAQRHEYDGPVTLIVDGLPVGVEIVADSIAAKKNEGELKLKANGKVEAFNIRIKGEIEQKDAKATKRFPVSTMPALRKLYPLQMFPSAAMDGWIAVNPPPR